MINFFKRLVTRESSLHEEQKAHFEREGRYLQVKRGGYRVDVFEAPGEKRGESVHGYKVNKE
jgi:hypothetical protein